MDAPSASPKRPRMNYCPEEPNESFSSAYDDGHSIVSDILCKTPVAKSEYIREVEEVFESVCKKPSSSLGISCVPVSVHRDDQKLESAVKPKPVSTSSNFFSSPLPTPDPKESQNPGSSNLHFGPGGTTSSICGSFPSDNLDRPDEVPIEKEEGVAAAVEEELFFDATDRFDEEYFSDSESDVGDEGWADSLNALYGIGDVDESKPCPCGCGKSFRSINSAEYYKAHLYEPLYSGTTMTTLEVSYALLMTAKFDGADMPREALNSLLAFFADFVLPQPNFMPKSMYMMKEVVGVGDWDEFERHVCTNKNCSGHQWPHVPKSEWEQHKHDTCPKCNSSRFDCSTPIIKPHGWCINFGLKKTLEDLLADAELLDDLRRDRPNPSPPDSYHASPEASRLQEWFRTEGNDPDFSWEDWQNLRIDLLVDWLQPYSSVSHSVGIISIRCADVSPRNLGKKSSSRIVAIIPGPKMPENANSYIIGILEEFKQALESRMTLSVKLPCSVDGQSAGVSSVSVRPILTGFLADSPARSKFSLWNSANAYIACGWCLFEGTPEKTTAGDKTHSTIYYRGYWKGVPQPIHFGGKCKKVGDRDLSLTDEAQMSRARRVEEGIGDKKTEGCRGVSIIPSTLGYVSYNDIWLLPVAHAFLYGVVKDFVGYLLRPFKNAKHAPGISKGPDIFDYEQRRLMSSRASHVRVTSDFGRKYKCVVQYWQSYKMEDWLHFLEVFALYIFKGVLGLEIKEMWDCLVIVGDTFFRPCAANLNRVEYEALVRKGADSLRRYANLLEKYEFPANMFTYNLHILVCRLLPQSLTRGHPARELEFVVEREVQEFKRGMGRRVCQNPEKTFANNMILLKRLRQLRASSEVPLKSVKEYLPLTERLDPAYDTTTYCFPGVEGSAYAAGAVLLGKGQSLSTRHSDRDVYIASASRHVQQLQRTKKSTAWTAEDVQSAFDTLTGADGVMLYKRAECNEDHVTSRHAAPHSSRVNHWVMVNYASPGNKVQPYIALVEVFLRIPFPRKTNPPVPALRLVVCHLYAARVEASQHSVLYHANLDGESHVSYSVPIEDIDGKLVAFIPPEGRVYYFARPMNMTTRA
jgi:hypothetical protein